jgi:glycosyltransferase involved in cell wall biosynthesis
MTATCRSTPFGDESYTALLGMGWFPDQPGGLNRYFSNLVGGLERAGVDARAVVLGPVTHPAGRLMAPADSADPLAHRLWKYHRAVTKMSPRAQLIDSHFALYNAIPAITGSFRGSPLVVHFHGPWAVEGTGDDSSSRILIKRALERAVYRRAAQVIVLSGAFKRVLVEDYGVSPWRISVVPPGIELAAFSPGSREYSRHHLGLPTSWLAVSVRRLVPRMGLDILLDAWAIVVQTRQDAVLALLGDGECRESLERQAAGLGLSNNVKFLGKVNDCDLTHWYRAADVSVVPSVAHEGFGLVILESLACGTPVIGTDVGGIPEALRPLDPSLIVPSSDASSLASRLLAAVNGTRPLPSSAECRAYSEAFSWDRVVTRTLALYHDVVQAPKKRRPRIVYLDHCAQLSGAELALLRILPALDRVDAHVLLGEDGPLTRKLTETGVSTEVFRMPKSARRLKRTQAKPGALAVSAGILTIWYVVRLARRLRQLKPDLVHTNSLKAAIYGGLACRLAGIPCLWHVRDRITPDYLPSPAIRLVRWLARRLPSSVIANSISTLVTLELPESLGSVIPSPVIFDPVNLAPAPYSAENGHFSFTVGMVGRMAPWKGQHVFIEAFARAFPAGDQTAVVVGAPLFGEDDYAEEVRTRAAGLGLNGRVHFVGFQDDVVGQMSRFDLLVHASIIPEPFGQVVVEGMAAGLPVLAARAGGPAEVIDDGVTGILYDPGNADALAQSLRRLAEDPALRKRLSEAARIRARDFTPEIIAEQVFGVYRTLLERTPNSSRLLLS